MTQKTRFKINIYRVNLRNPCLIFCYDRLEAQHAAPLLSQGLLYNLKHMEQLEHLSFKGQKALFVRLEELARIANMNKKERAEYEAALKIYRDNENVVTTARREGKEEGRKEGRACCSCGAVREGAWHRTLRPACARQTTSVV